MKKLLLTIGIIGGFVINSKAALITRTYTYTSGNTIDASQNNTNENTLYNEINGNLNNANILDGGIATADLANNAVTSAKLDTSLSISSANVTNLFGQYILLQSTQSIVITSSATTSASYIVTASSVTLTPRNAASYFRISVSGGMTAAVGNSAMFVTLFRNGTAPSFIGSSSGLCKHLDASAGGNVNMCNFSVEDKPVTASPVTYTVAIKSGTGGNSVTWNPDGATSILVEEIGK